MLFSSCNVSLDPPFLSSRSFSFPPTFLVPFCVIDMTPSLQNIGSRAASALSPKTIEYVHRHVDIGTFHRGYFSTVHTALLYWVRWNKFIEQV